MSCCSKLFRSLHVLLVLAILGVIGSASAQSGTDERQPPIAERNHERILTAAPNLTEMVFLLGRGDEVVGVSRFTRYPPQATQLPAVVDLVSANIEAIERLEPTLIFALPSQNKLIDYYRRKESVELVIIPSIETLDDVRRGLLEVAAALNREPQALAFLDSVQEKEPIELPEGAQRPDVLMVLGGGTGLSQLSVIGRGTYFNELLEAAGGQNVIPPEMGRYPIVNKETLLRLDPDIIVQFAEPEKVEERYKETQKAWKPLAPISAVRNQDFRFITDQGIMVPGPRLFTYRDLFKELLWEEKPGGSVP